MAQKNELSFLQNIGMMLTYQCPIACPHCIVEAGPNRREAIPLDKACDLIDQAKNFRNHQIRGLALTGGEPFLDQAKLHEISAYARRQGFIVSVVTNAFWANSAEQALATLAALPEIDALSFSTDRHHLNFIPLDNIQYAVSAARALGRPFNIAICTDNENDQEFVRLIEKVRGFVSAEEIRTSYVFPLGRASSAIKTWNHQLSVDPPVSACPMANSPVIFPDGHMVACIGPVLTLPKNHPLSLGNVYQEPLSVILDRADKNPVLHAIRAFGPKFFYTLATDYGIELALPDQTIENCSCDLCYRVLPEPRNLPALQQLAAEPEFVEKVAYARLYYLGESEMLDQNTGVLNAGMACC